MAKYLLLASALAGSASAFTPAALSQQKTALFSDVGVAEPVTVVEEIPEAPEPEATKPEGFCQGMVGGEGPEPVIFSTQFSSVDFDPAGFAERAPEWVPWFREAELKHGRAAMLACVGFVVPEMFRIPGEQFSFEAIPKVINAHDALPDSMIQIFGWISFIEACTLPAYAGMGRYDRRPGDFSFDPLGLYPVDEEKRRERQLQELKNGRLAMIAIGGMVAGAAVSGNSFPYLP